MAEMLEQKICQRTFIAASPEKVYDTVTDAASWDGFFTTGMRIDPKPGGICSFAWKDWGPDKYTLTVEGKVLEADRPGLFVFQWGPEDRATRIRIEMKPTEGGTVLTLTEEGYPHTDKGIAMMLECASGWGEAVTLLKFYIEHGIVYDSARK